MAGPPEVIFAILVGLAYGFLVGQGRFLRWLRTWESLVVVAAALMVGFGLQGLFLYETTPGAVFRREFGFGAPGSVTLISAGDVTDDHGFVATELRFVVDRPTLERILKQQGHSWQQVPLASRMESPCYQTDSFIYVENVPYPETFPQNRREKQLCLIGTSGEAVLVHPLPVD